MSRSARSLEADIGRWVDKGLIDAATGERLAQEAISHERRGFSFGTVLAVMAALLVGAAVLLFVAANLQEVPRWLRVLGVFGVIAASYMGGAVAKSRGYSGYGEALYLLGCLAFGGAIALIAQLYHMTGDESQAVLVWCFGAALGAGLLRSPILTNAAVALAMGWFLMTLDGGSGNWFNWWYLPLGIALWVMSYWSGGPSSRHLLLLSFITYAVIACIYSDDQGYLTLAQGGAILAAVSALVFLAAYFAPEQVERFARLGGPYPVYPVIGFTVGMSLIQAGNYEHFGTMLIASLVALAGIAAALLMRGRESRLMRWVAYAAFTVELIFIYVLTVGTMMDTSVLFLVCGLSLGAVAWFISRFEKKMAAKSEATS